MSNSTTKWFLVQTEKAYTMQQNSVFTIAAMDKNFSSNKIELEKLLLRAGVKVRSIRSAASFQKKKTKGKSRKTVIQFKPRKWFVSVAKDSIITEETIKTINSPLT